jgi:transposase
MHHKVREMLVRQRTQILNGLRGHLAEIGIIAAQGPGHAHALAELLRAGDASIPQAVAIALLPLVTQLEQLDTEIRLSDAAIAKLAWPIRWRMR